MLRDRHAGAVRHGDAVAGRDVGVATCRGTPCRRRRWPAASRARVKRVHRAASRGRGRRRPSRTARGSVGSRVASVSRSTRGGARGRGCWASRGPPPTSARMISRPVASEACRMRRWLWPPSRPRSYSRIVVLVAAREVGAEGDQVADALRPLAHHQLDDVAVAEAGAGDQGVLDVRLEGVVGAPHRGDAALGVARRALRQRSLREQRRPCRDRAACSANVRPARPLPMTRKSRP